MDLRGVKCSFKWILVSISLILVSCNNDSTTNSSSATVNSVKAAPAAPIFNSDSAFAFVKRQTDFGPRGWSSEISDLRIFKLSI